MAGRQDDFLPHDGAAAEVQLLALFPFVAGRLDLQPESPGREVQCEFPAVRLSGLQ